MEEFNYNIFNAINLGELLKRLNQENPNNYLSFGLGYAHSNRGYYDEIGFEIVENVSIKEMKLLIKDVIGRTFTGYKGGKYTYNENTLINLSSYGNCGGKLNFYILNKMLQDQFI